MLQRWLFQGLSFFCLFLCLPPAYAEEQADISTSYKGALCLIRAENKLVLINEAITRQLSLPGGTIKPLETPQQAAKRETWEETGRVVSVGKELGHTEQAVVFDCISDTEILAYQFQNSLGGYELPVWFAPDYGIEVINAMLIDPAFINSQRYRFPDDWSATLAMFTDATDQAAIRVPDLINIASSIHQSEIALIRTLQIWVVSLPEFWKSVVHTILNYGSHLASPICGIIMFPLLYWRSGRAICYKVSFAISITSLMCLLAQQGFSFPRPHVYFPNIQLVDSYGYGFPSLPIAVWSSIGILLLTDKERLGNNLFVIAYAISAIWLTLSKFYIGSAFLTDMVVGGFVGLLVTWNIIRFDIKRNEKSKTLMSSERVWWSVCVVTAILTYFWPLPVFASWLVVLLVVAVITSTLRKQRERISLGQALIFMAALIVVYWFASVGATYVSSSGLWSLLLDITRYPLMIIIFVFMVKYTAYTSGRTYDNKESV